MTESAAPIETIAGHPVYFIDQDEALASAAQGWREQAVLGIDTEFERSHTFFARPGLIQICDGSAAWLVDPIACGDLTPLCELLSAPAPLKIIHSGSEDFELLASLCGVTLKGLFDTQIASGLVGLRAAISYRDLVETVCGVTLEKGETRSNWLKRPLTDRQLHYAALDVIYLLDVHAWLVEKLGASGRAPWADEDTLRLAETAAAGADTERMYREFKLAWKLPPADRAALRALIDWRERHAADRDVPRRRVLDDDQLLELARNRPADNAAIGSLLGLKARKRDDVAPGVVAAVEAAASAPAPAAPPRPLDQGARKQIKAMKQIVEAAAERLAIEPTILASRRDLVALLNDGALPERLTGWRRAVVGQELEATLA
ncbi:MAG: ribonuclease D [Pseudomonadota bacterium]